MSQNQLRIGMVGAGFMGQLAHLDQYPNIENCHLVALAELRPELREKVAKKYNIQHHFATHQEMLEQVDLDAVIVVTARHMMGPVAKDCLEAGKHVLSEKPMAGCLEKAVPMVETAKKHNRRYIIGMLRRHDPGVLKAKEVFDEIIQNESLGPIQQVRAWNYSGDPYCQIDGHVLPGDEPVPSDRPVWGEFPQWLPEDLQRSFARFLNVHIHDINLLRFLLKEELQPEYVRLSDRPSRVAVFDTGLYPVVLETGWMNHKLWDEGVEVYFEKGRLRLELPSPMLRNIPTKVELIQGEGVDQTTSWQCEWTWAFRSQAQSFVDSILNDSPSTCEGDLVLQDHQLIEDMWKMELKRLGRA